MNPDRTENYEEIYDLLYRERWSDVIDLVHRNRSSIAGDEQLGRAFGMFTSAFFSRLEGDDPAAHRGELEKLFLLHVGGFYPLEGARFERVVEGLVSLNEGRPETAEGYARHCPDNAVCARVLARSVVHSRVDHSAADEVDLDSVSASEVRDSTISLFKSDQEIAFYTAVREVFATYLVYPNVAISTVIDFDAIRERLTPDERQYFFRGVIDCVVFDQHGGYRPLHFFELDSPLHDDAERSSNDGRKDRIITLAGRQLHRIRSRSRRAGKAAFVRLLRESVR